VRVIKQQDQKELELARLSFSSGSMPACSRPVPAWIEAAASQVRTPGQTSAADVERLERSAFDRGCQEAEKAALEAADRKIAAVMNRYAEAILEIGRVKRVLHAQAEREVVKLALEVAKKIVCREVQADPEIIQALVRIALGHVATKSPVTLHLNPADYNFMLERNGGAARCNSGDREMVLVADRSVDRGGCLIETDCGDIDARIEEKFREVEHSFWGSGDQESGA
jgi:flagellar assembly protein FliH